MTKRHNLTARHDSRQHGFAGAAKQDDRDVVGRLFERFQKRVRGRRTKRVDPIEDIHLMPASKRSQLGIGDKLANLFDNVALGTFWSEVMHVGMGLAVDAAARVCRTRLA